MAQSWRTFKSKKADYITLLVINQPFAVRTRFELVVRLPVRQFSKLVVSATHPPHQSSVLFPIASAKVVYFSLTTNFHITFFFNFIKSHYKSTQRVDGGRWMVDGGRWMNSTFNLQPSTLNSQPSTLNPQPSTLNPQPSTLNPQPSTLNPQPSTLNSQPLILNQICMTPHFWVLLHKFLR